jgi:hypothetical protein
MKLGTYTMVPEPTSTAYFINDSYQSVYLYVYIAGQRLGKNVTAAMNTYVTIETLLDGSFSMRSVSYESLTIQTRSLSLYSYQKDERALPGNLQNRW